MPQIAQLQDSSLTSASLAALDWAVGFTSTLFIPHSAFVAAQNQCAQQEAVADRAKGVLTGLLRVVDDVSELRLVDGSFTVANGTLVGGSSFDVDVPALRENGVPIGFERFFRGISVGTSIVGAKN